MFITAFPEKLPEAILRGADLFVAIGDDPVDNLAQFCELLGEPTPEVAQPADHKEHHALAWWRGAGQPTWFRRLAPRSEHRHHQHGDAKEA
jgi:hypothetical protein